jgi:hypothetical protein
MYAASTYVRPEEYKYGILHEGQFHPTGTNRYIRICGWFDLNANNSIGDTSQNSVILSTYGKYAHDQISLTDSLLNDRRAEIDLENRKFHRNNG